MEKIDSLMQVPVSNLKGISPEVVKSLNGLQISVVGDLLRVSSTRLWGTLKGLVTWDEICRWYGVAALLEVSGMTFSWAEALAELGLLTVRDFSYKSLEEIESLISIAVQKNLIESLPSASVLTEMLKDCVALCYSGTVMGTVVNRVKEPIAGVNARIGRFLERTDERGRFRISRIPFSGPTFLELSMDGFKSQTIKLKSVPDNDITTVKVFQLESAARRQEDSSQSAELSELAGDQLPPMKASYVRSRQEKGTIPDDEWLILTLIDQNKDTARLVSRLHSYKDGLFMVTVYKAPCSILDNSVQIGDEFRSRQGKLIKVGFTPRKLRLYKQLLQLKRKWKNEPRPVTPMEMQEVVQRRLNELFQVRALTGRSERRIDHA